MGTEGKDVQAKGIGHISKRKIPKFPKCWEKDDHPGTGGFYDHK
jgi:hypothetical protein